MRDYRLDFGIGGHDYGAWQAEAPGQPWHGLHENRTVFLDIAEGERIVYAYSMAMNGQIHSASLATVEFAAADTGTRLVFTKQIALYSAAYGVEGRIDGWQELLASLETLLSCGPHEDQLQPRNRPGAYPHHRRSPINVWRCLTEATEAGTKLTARAVHADSASRDQHEKMGFHNGWGTAIAQFAILAATL